MLSFNSKASKIFCWQSSKLCLLLELWYEGKSSFADIFGELVNMKAL